MRISPVFRDVCVSPLAVALAVTLAVVLGVGSARGQCEPTTTSRLGGDVPGVASIDSNRILVANNRGLEIHNVSNAASPIRTGRLEVGEMIRKMKVQGGRAYVVTGEGYNSIQQHIRVYNVTGAAPVFSSTLVTDDNLDFDIAGLYMYYAAHASGGPVVLTALDMSFRDPLFAGRLTFGDAATFYSDVSLSVSGSRAFVGFGTSNTWRLAAVNIADPSAMTVLGRYDNGASVIFGKVVTVGNYAYVCRDNRVEILSLTAFPGFPLAGTISSIGAYDAAAVGSTLFVASSYAGVRPYNLANPTAPSPFTPANTPGTSKDVEIVGDRLYNADREGGVTILQIGNPASITTLGSIAAPFPSRVQDMQSVGTTLYVLDELGLRIFSTTNPDAPTLLGSLTLADTTSDGCSSRTLGVHNGNAYITGCDAHLRVVSVANPAAPFQRADLSGFTADYDTAFSGNYGYFCGQSGLRIVNISNPSAPAVVGTYALGGVASSIEVQGSYAYLGTRDNGLWILSLANPVDPQLVGFSATPFGGACYGLNVSGTTAFLGRGNVFEITDITNPTNPTVIASIPELNVGVHSPVLYQDGILHVEGSFDGGLQPRGLHRIDVSTLTRPVVIGTLPGSFSAFAKIGSRTYIGDVDRSDMVISTVQTQWKPAFGRQPQDTTPCRGSYALFNVSVSAMPTSVTYRWHRNGVPLPLGGRFVGADASNLTIRELVLTDAGDYTCVATNSCGSTTSAIATLSFCTADFNCDGFVDFFDYSDFVECFESGNCGVGSADFNEDGFVDFFDYDDFVAAFEDGC